MSAEHGRPTLGVLRLWLMVSALGLAGLMVWAFVPILIPMGVVALGLGLFAGGMVAFARWIERRRGT